MPLIFTGYAGLHHVKSTLDPLTEHAAFQSMRVDDPPPGTFSGKSSAPVVRF